MYEAVEDYVVRLEKKPVCGARGKPMKQATVKELGKIVVVNSFARG